MTARHFSTKRKEREFAAAAKQQKADFQIEVRLPRDVGNSLGNTCSRKSPIPSECRFFTLCKLLIPNNRAWDFSTC